MASPYPGDGAPMQVDAIAFDAFVTLFDVGALAAALR
jgi:hypothetical protein